MSDRVLVSVGTKRGLFLLESDASRASWELRGPLLKGWKIFHAVVDGRGTPRLHAAAVSDAFAATTVSGDPFGSSFEAAESPPIPPELLPEQRKWVEKWNIPSAPRIWHIEPGGADEPGVLYAGTAPAALFRSEDDGKSWTEVEGLSEHPSRKEWQPGAGGLALHSIQIDPEDADRIYVGISAAGVFRSDDGGENWKAVNKGIANFEGGVVEEGGVGTCVHKLLIHPGKPNRLYQQNHIGVYRSDDRGDSWQRIDEGLPFDFGFGLAFDPHDAETCFVTPLEPDEYTYRATPGTFCVYRFAGTPDAPAWDELDNGLPSRWAFLNVLREGMANDPLDPCGLYVGTGTGQLFHSADAGESWREIVSYLPPILSVSVTVI